MSIIYPGAHMHLANTVGIPRVQIMLMSSACSCTSVADARLLLFCPTVHVPSLFVKHAMHLIMHALCKSCCLCTFSGIFFNETCRLVES